MSFIDLTLSESSASFVNESGNWNGTDLGMEHLPLGDIRLLAISVSRWSRRFSKY